MFNLGGLLKLAMVAPWPHGVTFRRMFFGCILGHQVLQGQSIQPLRMSFHSVCCQNILKSDETRLKLVFHMCQVPRCCSCHDKLARPTALVLGPSNAQFSHLLKLSFSMPRCCPNTSLTFWINRKRNTRPGLRTVRFLVANFYNAVGANVCVQDVLVCGRMAANCSKRYLASRARILMRHHLGSTG